jgi:hypothetical protein
LGRQTLFLQREGSEMPGRPVTEEFPLFRFIFPDNPYTAGTQNHTLFEYLKEHRAITTQELHYNLRMDTARIRDLRKHLRIDCRSIPGIRNNRLYKVRP